MDYLSRWIEIREKYFRAAPALIGRFGGDSLAPLFAEIDEQVVDGDAATLAAIEDRMREQLHTLEPRLLELLAEADEPTRAALFEVRDSVLELREEFSDFVMNRAICEQVVDDHPFSLELEPIPTEPEPADPAPAESPE